MNKRRLNFQWIVLVIGILPAMPSTADWESVDPDQDLVNARETHDSDWLPENRNRADTKTSAQKRARPRSNWDTIDPDQDLVNARDTHDSSWLPDDRADKSAPVRKREGPRSNWDTTDPDQDIWKAREKHGNTWFSN